MACDWVRRGYRAAAWVPVPTAAAVEQRQWFLYFPIDTFSDETSKPAMYNLCEITHEDNSPSRPILPLGSPRAYCNYVYPYPLWRTLSLRLCTGRSSALAGYIQRAPRPIDGGEVPLATHPPHHTETLCQPTTKPVQSQAQRSRPGNAPACHRHRTSSNFDSNAPASPSGTCTFLVFTVEIYLLIYRRRLKSDGSGKFL